MYGLHKIQVSMSEVNERLCLKAKFVHFEFLIHSNNIQVEHTCHKFKAVRNKSNTLETS